MKFTKILLRKFPGVWLSASVDHKYNPLSTQCEEFYDANDGGPPQSVSDGRSPDVEEDPDYVERADISSKFTNLHFLSSSSKCNLFQVA